MQAESPAPLILTLSLDGESFSFFNGLRQKYFPPERNFIDAHLTLFHYLPNDAATIETITTIAAQIKEPILLQVTGLMRLGGGVAYRIEAPLLIQLHSQLQQALAPHLTPQDKQGLRPHITVQNKVRPAEAEALFNQLSNGFESFTAQGTGLTIWEYKGGPWQWLQQFDFTARQ